jgi:hypothetical protein
MQYDRFAQALAEGGHEKRGQDTYGTLLACAAMLLGDELAAELGVPLGPEEERYLVELLAADSLPEVEDSKPNYRQCVDRILTSWSRPGAIRRTTPSARSSTRLRTTNEDGAGAIEPQIDRNTAKRDINIAGFGLFNTHEIVAGVMRNQGPHARGRADQIRAAQAGWVLAVPHQSSKVAELLEGTDWQRGGWRDAFQQCTTPGVMIRTDPINKVTIDGVQQRCTLIVLDRYHEAPENPRVCSGNRRSTE